MAIYNVAQNGRRALRRSEIRFGTKVEVVGSQSKFIGTIMAARSDSILVATNDLNGNRIQKRIRIDDPRRGVQLFHVETQPQL